MPVDWYGALVSGRGGGGVHGTTMSHDAPKQNKLRLTDSSSLSTVAEWVKVMLALPVSPEEENLTSCLEQVIWTASPNWLRSLHILWNSPEDILTWALYSVSWGQKGILTTSYNFIFEKEFLTDEDRCSSIFLTSYLNIPNNEQCTPINQFLTYCTFHKKILIHNEKKEVVQSVEVFHFLVFIPLAFWMCFSDIWSATHAEKVSELWMLITYSVP